MSTLLAAQLSRIAADSNNSLNLKAQKAAHSKSLIFEARVASSQSFDTLYTLCHEGFQELCLLDGRFLEFQRDLFSEQSQEQDRTQMNAQQNADLDRRVEAFLGLVGSRLRLNPAIKAVEWLIRRFRIHENNTSFLLTTFLPYHTLPVFTTLLSILPTRLPEEYKFLQPYIRSLMAPARHVIVQTATNNVAFAALLNSYVIRISSRRQQYAALLAFWAGVTTEAVGAMMDKSRSGRRNVQQQNEQDVIVKLLPTLNEGLAMKKVPDLRVACYMILAVMASKGGLDDKVLTAMMEAVVLGWTTETTAPGLVCMSVLAQQRKSAFLSKRVVKELLRVPDLVKGMAHLSEQHRVEKLANALCLTLIERARKDGDTSGLLVVEAILTGDLLGDKQLLTAMRALLQVANDTVSESVTTSEVQTPLAASLLRLTSSSETVGAIMYEAASISGIDIDDLELKLQITIPPQAQLQFQEDSEMDDLDAGGVAQSDRFKALLDHLPKRTAAETSLLSPTTSHIYPELCRALIAASANSQSLDSLDTANILDRESGLSNTIYLSFYMRAWCGPNPMLSRLAALHMVSARITSAKSTGLDLQALLPYVAVALCDPASRVRRAAADLAITINAVYAGSTESKKKTKQLPRWGETDLYGPAQTKDLAWLTTDTASKFTSEILLPALEECVLDDKHVFAVLQNALGKTNGENPKKPEGGRLSQAARTSIMSFLSSHIRHTPLLTVRLRLLRCVNTIRSVAGTSRTKFLLPTLISWVNEDSSVVAKACADENLDIEELNEQILAILTPNDKEGLQILQNIMNGKLAPDKASLIRAAYKKLHALWSSLKTEDGMSFSQSLLDTSQAGITNDAQSLASEEAAGFLRSATLTTEILALFLDNLPTAAKLIDTPPATKRRRTSHGEVARTPVQDSAQLSTAIRRVTFVLQLIHSSEPAVHPQLLRPLFNTLAELQHFKAQVASELAYLQGLVLECLLAIFQAEKSNPKLKLDKAAVRADLLVDCIQKTSSPQVQNAALLLVACLADSAPDLVLHSVMPIFTFIGNSVLRQNDEYSAHVITQTIRQVIPPLITALRKDKGNPVTGAAELLLSFVAAYEHVPSHRRKGLFLSLVQTLGAEDFLFALLAMLADKYGATAAITSFAVEISSSFAVETQLQSFVKNIDLIFDLLIPKPTYSNTLLGASDDASTNVSKTLLTQLSLLPPLMSHKQLVNQTAKLLDRDDMDAARIRDVYATMLEKVLVLADSVRSEAVLHEACGDVLESLLGLLSTSEFVKSVESLLDKPSEILRRKILRALEVRIDQESASNPSSRSAMLSFLPQLTAIIRESRDVLYKHVAVSCVDKIAEKYGKKDLEAVAAAAETIASAHCLGQNDARLRVIALLCLASLVDILREGIVSVLPTAISTCLDYLETDLEDGAESVQLQNAGFAFISALIENLPYMLSGGYLDRFLSICNVSVEADVADTVDNNRTQCLQLAAKQIDAKSMFGALEKSWQQAVVLGSLAVGEYLQVLDVAVTKHPKSVVTKYSQSLARLLHQMFDLRREWHAAKRLDLLGDLEDIEATVIEIAIKIIYKLNDATFRPIFSGLIDWATTGLPKKDRLGRTRRLQTLYGFMSEFFGNLKSIVTSYSAYLLENFVQVLQAVDLKDVESRELWSRALRTLQKSFEHDQDDFWQSPSHFGVIAPVLCAQFLHASSLPLEAELLPAIVELAAAADSSEHHKELNGAILKHMRSETASVRLAAVKCEQAITEKIGEEWLAMLPEMLPFISELQEDDDDVVERETHRWIVSIEEVLGESLDSMLQ